MRGHQCVGRARGGGEVPIKALTERKKHPDHVILLSFSNFDTLTPSRDICTLPC